jgi:hypothetical protein
MDFRIKNIILWPKDENKETRIIPFETDKINIITGESHKGKSSLVHIIDYCLGSKKCTIPVGIIRNKTDWFALHIILDKTEILVARKEPGQQISTGEMYFNEESEIDLNVKPFSNTNSKNVVNQFNRIGRFSTVDFQDEESIGFLKDRASFRDTSAFQFQPQHIIANPYTLFFKADTFEHQEKLKTIFPLVLGVINNETLALRKELRELENELRRKQNALNEKKRAKDTWLSSVSSLYLKAKSLGLLPNAPTETEDWDAEKYSRYLVQVLENFRENPIPAYEPGTAEKSSSVLGNLIERERNVAREISSREIKLSKILKVNDTKVSYKRTIDVKQSRLEPISWFNNKLKNENCPFCGSEHETAKEQVASLQEVAVKLETISKAVASPDLILDKEIGVIRQSIKELEEKRKGIRENIRELTFENDKERQKQNTIEGVYRFIGRLEEALENVQSIEIDSDLDKEIKNLTIRINEIKKRIRENEEKSKLENAISKLSSLTANYVELLHIDKPKDVVKLDIQNLTLRIVSENNRENYLWEIGSGANWMGYHISIMLALHEFFLELTQSHVPTFLFIDQPTQVYFPEKWPEHDRINELEQDEHSDFIQARKIFKALELAMKRTKNKLQIIVTEHAPKLTWQEIESVNLVEEWRGDNEALIPSSW